jgi:hypothetical protein
LGGPHPIAPGFPMEETQRERSRKDKGSTREDGFQRVLPFYREGNQRAYLTEQDENTDRVNFLRPDYKMHTTLTTLIDRLDSSAVSGTGVIEWGSPVPSFGDLSTSKVATLGLNPSNREFLDEKGVELQGAVRRFHTLNSLGLSSWADADTRHLRLIIESCRLYFLGNPYDRWFKRLDFVISGANASYYETAQGACHLDLIPYATARKWTELSTRQRSSLLTIAADTLGLLLKDSPVQTLILNGKSVVEHFQKIAGIRLDREKMPTWSLPRVPKPDVTGYAYQGFIESMAGIALPRRILVLGYNHNLQSSFGVTTQVIKSIQKWISEAVNSAVA